MTDVPLFGLPGRPVLLGSDGKPIQQLTAHIPSLPEIDRDALPGLPDDMEARFLAIPDDEPMIVIFHPRSEAHICMSLLARDNLAFFVEKVRIVAENMAMGEPPADDEYR